MLHCRPFDFSGAYDAFLPSPLYMPTNLAYQKEYMKNWVYKDISLAFFYGEDCVAFLIAAYGESSTGDKQISAFGLPLIYQETEAILPEMHVSIVNKLKQFFGAFIEDSSIQIVYTDYLQHRALSPVATYLLDKGATCTPEFSAQVNLRFEQKIMWQHLRNSYKSLINKSRQEFVHTTFDVKNISSSLIEEFCKLHYEVSGFYTRSSETWEKQFEAIKAGHAFMQTIHAGDVLLGASYYILSPVHCYYGVGAFRREYFEKPVAHGALWNAILYAKQHGCHWFEAGSYFFPFQQTGLTPKEISIGMFKRGFSSTLFPFFKITLGENK